MKEKLLGSTSLTRGQRAAILDRDGHMSQMQHYNEEQGFFKGGLCTDGQKGNCDNLHVHHLTPKRLLQHAPRDVINDPTNLITLAQCDHVGVCRDRKIGT